MATVMIIDDDATLRRGLSIRLKAAQFDVVTAEHPDSALNLALRRRPDVILMDIEMPHFSGLDFHECLRVTERGRDIPVVYLSGVNSPSNLEDAFRQGARAFIAKPYDPHELLATIRGVLARQSVMSAVPS